MAFRMAPLGACLRASSSSPERELCSAIPASDDAQFLEALVDRRSQNKSSLRTRPRAAMAWQAISRGLGRARHLIAGRGRGMAKANRAEVQKRFKEQPPLVGYSYLISDMTRRSPAATIRGFSHQEAIVRADQTKYSWARAQSRHDSGKPSVRDSRRHGRRLLPAYISCPPISNATTNVCDADLGAGAIASRRISCAAQSRLESMRAPPKLLSGSDAAHGRSATRLPCQAACQGRVNFRNARLPVTQVLQL